MTIRQMAAAQRMQEYNNQKPTAAEIEDAHQRGHKYAAAMGSVEGLCLAGADRNYRKPTSEFASSGTSGEELECRLEPDLRLAKRKTRANCYLSRTTTPLGTNLAWDKI